MAKKTDKAAEAAVVPVASQDDPKAAETAQTADAAKEVAKATDASANSEAPQGDPKVAESAQTADAAKEDAKATDASANSEAPQGDPKVAESAQTAKAAQDEPAGEVTAETVPDGMVAVEFLRGYVVKDHHEGTDKQTSYAEGEVVVLSEASAQHFISRGAAKEV